MLKKHFKETVKRVRPKYDRYKIDEMAKKYACHRITVN
jgi:hypothetical protein